MTSKSGSPNDIPVGQQLTTPQRTNGATMNTTKHSIYDIITLSKYSPSAISAPYRNSTSVFHRPLSTFIPNNGENNEKNQLESDLTSRTLLYMPYPVPWAITATPPTPPPDFAFMQESCGAKAAIGIFGGGAMGLLLGVFLGAMSDMTPPVTIINGKDVPQAPLKEQMHTTLRATAEKSLYWCRQFAFITGVFGGTECLVEKYRGKHDVWNEVISGCATGAALQAKSGPSAAAIGCGGFAAFSLILHPLMN